MAIMQKAYIWISWPFMMKIKIFWTLLVKKNVTRMTKTKKKENNSPSTQSKKLHNIMDLHFEKPLWINTICSIVNISTEKYIWSTILENFTGKVKIHKTWWRPCNIQSGWMWRWQAFYCSIACENINTWTHSETHSKVYKVHTPHWLTKLTVFQYANITRRRITKRL